ncbi:MAG: 16S rRNA (guanine(966)-N(2))-methyltransferase RsmD [Verrucomicrobia bacterium]|nr:16S rRNA (guanine(966)-N(2))-methyltransferase RsmD [Kiritimatiellia bacterium]MCP5489049.1 16S rRNA (guanine(966)-N(2))-methyltransferase RsmD [Verrucomicrobiota bacterium]
MIRITAGRLGGRHIKTPGDQVRPTQDRVRQALYSSLGAFVGGAKVLDLYAGTGALGLEALSRGADRVTWVEQSAKVFAGLVENVRTLAGEASADCHRSDVLSFLRRPPRPPAPYDLVLADPPYDHPDASAGRLMDLLTAQAWMVQGGVFVYEQRARTEKIDKPGWGVLKDERYGETRLVLYRQLADPMKERV